MYRIELNNGDVIDNGLSLVEAECARTQACNDGINTYIVDDSIHRPEPYLDGYCSDKTAFIEMIYVPPSMRRKGIASILVKDWISQLDIKIEKVKLMPMDTAGIMTFWCNFGFKKAYTGDHLYDEIENALFLGVNGHPTPEPELIFEGDQYRHWLDE